MNRVDALNNHYDDMLELRESFGYSNGKKPHCVKEFIAHCCKCYPDSVGITRKMVDSWLEDKHFGTSRTRNYEITQIRVFARYLESIGIPAFVPNEDYSARTIQYTPYLFTDQELARLFEAIDGFQPHYTSPNREYIVPVLFRMMYCCGMRPSEPPSLLIEDVDLNNGEVYIRQAKRHRDRRILMSPELTALCREYASHMMPQKYFLEKNEGVRISSRWVGRQFHFCWRNSGLQKRGDPRPYDLRHNFAARTMMRWVNEGRDVSVLAPYLSAYMGHAEFSSTLYYIHLLPERLQKSVGIDWARFSKIYPEVYDEQN